MSATRVVEEKNHLALLRVVEKDYRCPVVGILANHLAPYPAFALLAPRVNDFFAIDVTPETIEARRKLVFDWYTTTFVATFLRAAKLNDHADAIENAKTLEARVAALNAAYNAAYRAARSAAVSAAGSAAEEALKPVVEELQTSLAHLLLKLLEVGRSNDS